MSALPGLSGRSFERISGQSGAKTGLLSVEGDTRRPTTERLGISTTRQPHVGWPTLLLLGAGRAGRRAPPVCRDGGAQVVELLAGEEADLLERSEVALGPREVVHQEGGLASVFVRRTGSLPVYTSLSSLQSFSPAPEPVEAVGIHHSTPRTVWIYSGQRKSTGGF